MPLMLTDHSVFVCIQNDCSTQKSIDCKNTFSLSKRYQFLSKKCEHLTASAQRLLWRAARGIPRLINILAHKSLMLAYGRGENHIDRSLVRAAVRDTADARHLPWWRFGAVVLLAVPLLLWGIWR